MGTIIKKNIGFLYWVLLPSLLLMASVLGVNFVSRPGATLYGSFHCTDMADPDSACNAVRNNCVIEFCNSLDPNVHAAYCDIASYDANEGGNCGNCYVCGNGRCEPGAPVPEDSITCPNDCLRSADHPFTGNSFEPTCSLGVACGEDLENGDQASIPFPPIRDGCCPPGCQGRNPNGPNFDEDCCDACGDGFFNSLIEDCGEPGAPTCATGEFCSPASCLCLPNCRINGQLDDIDGNGTIDEVCDPQAVPTGCPAGEACDQTCNCQPIPPSCGNGTLDPGEECEPPNTATCDANCQLLPICGNGIVEVGEACEGTTCNATINGEAIPGVCVDCQCIPECQTEGSGCGDDGTGNTGVCFTGTGGTGGGSLIPVGVHAGVLAQWLATFAIPGAAFVGLKVRRRFRK